jgi:hypothetical protein
MKCRDATFTEGRARLTGLRSADFGIASSERGSTWGVFDLQTGEPKGPRAALVNAKEIAEELAAFLDVGRDKAPGEPS